MFNLHQPGRLLSKYFIGLGSTSCYTATAMYMSFFQDILLSWPSCDRASW